MERGEGCYGKGQKVHVTLIKQQAHFAKTASPFHHSPSHAPSLPPSLASSPPPHQITKPHRIILVRHGESTGNADERVYVETPDWKVGGEGGRGGRKVFLHDADAIILLSILAPLLEQKNVKKYAFPLDSY